MSLKYQNIQMDHEEALDIAIDMGRLTTDRDARNRAIPGTSRVRITPCGDGYDIVIPAEHAAKMVRALKGRLRAFRIPDPTDGCRDAK